MKVARSSVAAFAALLLASSAWAASTITRTSSFAYDGSGLLIQEVVEPDTPALRLQTDYTYDAFGNKLSVSVSGVGVTSRTSQNSYVANGQFPATATNALGQSESYQFDPRFGQPVSHTGPNGLTTSWSYDGFGRKIQVVSPDGTRTKWTYSFCSGVNGGTVSCPTGASYLTTETPYAADGTTIIGPVLTVYFDQLDREIIRDTQGFDGSTLRAAKQYDALGRVSKSSRPYVLASGTPQWTNYTYDIVGRVVTEARPDGAVTQMAYHGLSVTETNAKGQTRTVVKNSQEKLVSVTDPAGKTMTYAYDAVGNAVQTTDADGNIVTAIYDQRGRRIASSDPDLGSWTYTYNVFGELTSQTDAKSQTTSITYDILGRMVQRVEATMTSVWTYDTAAHGIGKLASSGITAGAGAGFTRSLTYDALGRASQIATTVDGTTYTMGAVYDANSRLSKVSYPSGFTARYGYNSLGFANQLFNDATGQVHWTANAMDAEGHLTQTTAGNGLVTNRGFDLTNGRLISITTGAGSAVQSLFYTYDALGNPLSRSDATVNVDETFTYDALNRLTSSTVTSLPTPLLKSFTYSSIGNLLAKSDVGNYSYPPAGSPQPHAVTSISGGAVSTTFTYDPNGNQTSGLGRSTVWTSYNKPASITQGARTISFLDDTEHQRFKQVTPEGTTLYIGGFGVLAEISNPGTSSASWTDYLTVGNVRVGMQTLQVASATLATRYFHTDHLGSISVLTDTNGVVVQRLSYDAWGKRRNLDGSDDTTGSITSQTTRGFTGQEELSVGGLVHLNGRVYDPLLARMTSADPTVTDPTNPQGWNRYSYVGNDPLAFTDPSGFSWLSRAWSRLTHFVMNNPILRAVIQVVATVVLAIVLPVVVPAVAGVLNLALSAAGGSAISTGLSGGNIGQILRSAAIAGATAIAFNIVGGITNVAAGASFSEAHVPLSFDAPGAYAVNVAGHALVGCGAAVASGGKCGPGALSGAVGSAAGPFLPRGDFAMELSSRAVLGGLASVAGGGKFANGAVTAAFGYMFNEAGGYVQRGYSPDESGQPAMGVGEVAQCFIRCAAEQFGAQSILGASSVSAGLPLLDKPFSVSGSSGGTSIASKYLSEAFPERLPFRVPAPTWNNPGAQSLVLGRVVGRWVPIVGWGIIGYDVVATSYCTYKCATK